MLCGAHYQGEPGSEGCDLVHLPRLKVERDHAQSALQDAIAHSITSAAASDRMVEDPYRAAEYAANMLTIHKPELLVELARLFGAEDEAQRVKAREIDHLRAVLREIAGLDYRGYPHESARIARKALDGGG